MGLTKNKKRWAGIFLISARKYSNKNRKTRTLHAAQGSRHVSSTPTRWRGRVNTIAEITDGGIRGLCAEYNG